MANVSIWEQTEGKTSQMPIRSKIGSLLEKVTTQDPKSQVLVAINARLSKTILASGQYTRIELDEARALSDPGVVIHQRLCGAIDQGDTWTISMTKLISYAWPEEAKLRHSGRRRKQKVLEVLDELVVLGWKWVEDTPDNFKITRPS
jgi:hypothetical protein